MSTTDSAPPDTTVPSPPTSLPPLDTDALVAFVEAARERSFPSPPTITVRPAGPPPAPTAPERLGAVDFAFAVLFGLAEPDSKERYDEFFEARRSAIGWGRCCPVEAQASATDSERTAAIIVHELVHQLDGAPLSFGGSIEARAYELALAEGNAVRIEEQFVATLGRSLDEFRPEDDPLPPDVPARLVALVQAPYSLGYRLAVAVADASGEAGIDTAFEVGPSSAEQVLFPEKFLAGEEPLDVDRPPTPEGMNIVRFGTVGSFVLKLAVEPGLGEEAALDVVAPWSGDAYTLAKDDDRICVLANIVMDDAGSAAALADAVRVDVAPTQVTATDRTVFFENCTALGEV